MARNEKRRLQLLDAGIEVLAEAGGRGLTHRAVDRGAGVPSGTASNYFPSRAALVEGLATRIYERLTPEPEVAAALAERPPSRALYADYLRDIVRRLTQHRALTLALFELRLEASRNPEVQATIGGFLMEAFRGDAEFAQSAGLRGGAFAVALFHYAIDGLLLDRLTTPIDPDTSTDRIIDALVEALLPPD